VLRKKELHIQCGWNQTHDCLALSSEPPNLAFRWRSIQEEKTHFHIELKTAVTTA
jgi:hypothetical protein